MRSAFAKRAFDLIGASLTLAAASPIMAATSAAVRLRHGSPILFRQRRPGLRGELFEIYKFRTMKDGTDASGTPLPDEQRLTALGRFLRATSLDELPELLNVIKGDMSLVGPRPLLPEYLDLYTPEQARRHDAKPGITGWVQVNGRNALTWEEKFELDCWYVDNATLVLDIEILLRTVAALIRRDGISHADSATMPKFKGTTSPKQDEATPPPATRRSRE